MIPQGSRQSPQCIVCARSDIPPLPQLRSSFMNNSIRASLLALAISFAATSAFAAKPATSATPAVAAIKAVPATPATATSPTIAATPAVPATRAVSAKPAVASIGAKAKTKNVKHTRTNRRSARAAGKAKASAAKKV